MDCVDDVNCDVIVVGAGPAGLAFAACASRAGLRICVVDSNPGRPWHCTYCTWLHELDSSWLQALLRPGEQLFDQRWEQSTAVMSDGATVHLGQGYGRINSDVLRGAFLRACEENGAQVVAGHVVQVDHYEGWSEVLASNGSLSRARMVLDASGHYSTLLEHDLGPRRRWQSFVGETLRCSQPHRYPLDTAVIFDWRDPVSELKAIRVTPPSFAYVLPLDERTLFVEETVLVADDKAQLDVLDARLQQRKLLLGLVDAEVVGMPEKYSFPMGGALPVMGQRIVGLGGAARMVHPATGYCVAYTLKAVPVLVETIRNGLLDCRKIPEVAESCWASLWSLDKQRLHTIYSMGSDVLVSLDRAEFSLFFFGLFRDYAS